MPYPSPFHLSLPNPTPFPYPTILHLTLPYPFLLTPTLPYPTLSLSTYPTLLYHTKPYLTPTLPYPLPYHTLSTYPYINLCPLPAVPRPYPSHCSLSYLHITKPVAVELCCHATALFSKYSPFAKSFKPLLKHVTESFTIQAHRATSLTVLLLSLTMTSRFAFTLPTFMDAFRPGCALSVEPSLNPSCHLKQGSSKRTDLSVYFSLC